METIVSRGAPDMHTPGVVGDLYVDKDTDKVYRCLNVTTEGSELGFVKVTAYHIDNRTYEWEELGAGPTADTTDWLFRNEYITGDGRPDLPGLDPDGSYTVFVDGIEYGNMEVLERSEDTLMMLCYANTPRGPYYLNYMVQPGGSGWVADSGGDVNSIRQAIVSIRVNH